MQFIILSLLSSIGAYGTACSGVRPLACPSISAIKCLIAGSYQENAPRSTQAVAGYYENFSLNDPKYTLLNTFYCPEPIPCPMTFAPILETSGSFQISKVKCPRAGVSGSVSFTLTLSEKINSLGMPQDPPTTAVYSASIPNTGNFEILQLVDPNGKPHAMIKR